MSVTVSPMVPSVGPALFQAIRQLCYKDDSTGRRIAVALKRAVLRGVRVCVVIDGHWATVGSSNTDPFSLLLSYAANVVIDNRAFGAALAESLRMSVASDSEQISAADWKRQPMALRFISWLCYGLLRLMTEISGYDSESRLAHDLTDIRDP